LPGVLLVTEGSGCLGSVFVFLDAIRCRRVLLREGCGCSFLISYGRVPINDQSEHAEGMNSLLTFVFSHQVLPPNFLGVSVCLTRGHIDWKGRGVRSGFILPPG
jgi:hypothetical protein